MELFVEKAVLQFFINDRFHAKGICFLFPEPVFLQTIVFRVWVLDLEPISAMYALGSWLGLSDEIRLYANNTQRIYTE